MNYCLKPSIHGVMPFGIFWWFWKCKGHLTRDSPHWTYL